MTNIFKHIRTYIFRGLLAIIPLLLTTIAITLLYKLIDKKVMSFIEQYIEIRHIPGMGILLVLICLYLIGLVFSNVIGKQIFVFIGQVTERIPFIKFIYQMGKELSESFSLASDKQAFQKVLLVKNLTHDGWMIGFLTGTVKDNATGEELLRVLISATHNPLFGYIVLVKPEQTRDPGWSVEETVKAMVSVGIIFPAEIKQ
ncbi:MAG: DUF502 domain-containing protein [Candidatus Omnitrophica bacterium]|nr:DUF502 domain-containing protein [Candidatus Omnitrophota bacterium]